MMIFRLSCPQHMRHVVSSTDVSSQSWPIFMVHLNVRDLIEKRCVLSFREARATRNPYPRHTCQLWGCFDGDRASRSDAWSSLSMTEKPGYCFPDKLPIRRSKNLAESTSAATLELA